MADITPLMWVYKFAREIARRMPHFRGEPPAFHPAFALGSAAAIVEHAEGAIPSDAPRIVYSEEDEAALETYVRATGTWLIPSFSFQKRHHSPSPP
jgi:alcohol oxidase